MRNTLIIPLLFLFSFSADAQYVFKEYDTNPGTGDGYPQILSTFGSKLVFVSSDGVHGTEPWISDGTDTGTHMIADVYAGASSSYINACCLWSFTEYNGKIYFAL